MNIAAFLLAFAAIGCLLWDIYHVRGPGVGQIGRFGLVLFIASFSAQLIWVTHHQVVLK